MCQILFQSFACNAGNLHDDSDLGTTVFLILPRRCASGEASLPDLQMVPFSLYMAFPLS